MTQKTNTPLAIGLMLVAMATIPLIDVCAKYLGEAGMPVAQTVWARFLFGTLFTLPFALHVAGASAVRPTYPKLQTARAALLILGTFGFFAALKYLPIADTLAIYFVQPLLITALSPLVLKEHVGVRRWLAVVIGFIGVLIIIRPGFHELNAGVFFALGAGFCSAMYILLTRHLTGAVDPIITTFQTSLIGAVGLSLVMPVVWEWPTIQQWLQMMALGFFGIFGHYLITKAYNYAEASLLSPLGYTEMVTAVLFGWYFFGDFPDNWTFVGVAILIACAIYISWRERLVMSRKAKST